MSHYAYGISFSGYFQAFLILANIAGSMNLRIPAGKLKPGFTNSFLKIFGKMA